MESSPIYTMGEVEIMMDIHRNMRVLGKVGDTIESLSGHAENGAGNRPNITVDGLSSENMAFVSIIDFISVM